MKGRKQVRCPYCERDAVLVTGDTIYPRRPDLHHKLFWLCRPCDAYVGCHGRGDHNSDGTLPLGRLANLELRKAKIAAHDSFDKLWKNGKMKRKHAYQWLALSMGIPFKHCHIGEFDVEQCQRVVRLCEARKSEAFLRHTALDKEFERAIA